MQLIKLFFAAVLPTLAISSAIAKRSTNQVFSGAIAITSNTLSAEGTDTYTMYTGDGSIAAGWPSMDDWISFDEMFEANKPLLAASCSNQGFTENSPEEIQDIYDGIQSISVKTNVDHRFVLAIIMQESSGCVRVKTTVGGNSNPGLVQSHAGQNSCNLGGSVSIPCPRNTIFGMIEDGVGGTDSGDGLASLLNLGEGISSVISSVASTSIASTNAVSTSPNSVVSTSATSSSAISTITNVLTETVTVTASTSSISGVSGSTMLTVTDTVVPVAAASASGSSIVVTVTDIFTKFVTVTAGINSNAARTAEPTGYYGRLRRQNSLSYNNSTMVSAQSFYQAARRYNSGSIDPSGDLGRGVATHCYASDIGNRLAGWTSAASKCDLDF